MTAKGLKHFFKYVVIDLLLAALISFFLINYVVSAYKVEGDSMKPLLHDQERLLISKLAINRKNLRRFDIVVLFRPMNPTRRWSNASSGCPRKSLKSAPAMCTSTTNLSNFRRPATTRNP